MHNLEKVDPADEPRTYRQQSFPRRLSVAVAGSAMHFLLAFLLLVVMWTAVGVPRPTLAIGEISKEKGSESPAQRAGFRVNDRVLAVNGRVLKRWEDLPPLIQKRPNQPTEFIVQRGDQVLKLDAVPAALPSESNKSKSIGFVGISTKFASDRADVPTAVWRSGKDLGHYTWATFGALGSVFAPSHLRDYTSQLSGRGAVTGKDAERPVSVVGFVRVAGQAAQHGFLDLLVLLVAINIFIGIFNLVPLLPLDGGHVAIAAYERVRSRKGRKYRADVTKLLPLTAAVVSLLVIFGAMTIYLDIVRPIANPFQ
jgi:membrane-associated protease RseP (regulator of RpoE activity)